MNDFHKNGDCPFCKSKHVRRHGTTPKGSVRFRCLSCKKTWTLRDSNKESPDSDILTSIYLQGLSYRQIRAIYQMSPMRLNQRIRDFLTGCPSWEDYLDSCVKDHNYKVITLYGAPLQTSHKGRDGKNLHIALAVDAMATVVIGYECASEESVPMWRKLLTRLVDRKVKNPRFLYDASNSFIEKAIKEIYPDSPTKDFSFRFVYDQKLQERVGSPSGAEDMMDNTIINILSPFDFFSDGYLSIFKDPRMKKVILGEREQVLHRLLTRLRRIGTTRLEGLISALQDRFKAFRFLKEDPRPIINGWIAWYMVQTLEIGYSRLSLYMQKPVSTGFKNFSCGQIPEPMIIDNQDRLVRFVVEIATRRLQLPLF